MQLSSDPAARRRLALLAGAALFALGIGIAIGAGAEQGEDGAAAKQGRSRQEPLGAVDRLSLRQQVGQLTISSFQGTRPPAYIRRRLSAGETAGVILFSFNAGSPAQWERLTRAIQHSAGDGALVMVDQEGGAVRAVAWAGPAAGQPLQGSPAMVERAARATAGQLRAAGVNVNLAPVADVPAGPATALGSRSFAGDARAIADRTRAAIDGMWAERVAAAAKHFPGLGRAAVNTDDGAAAIAGDLSSDLVPFRAAVRAHVPLVMLSHALYPALDPRHIASQSPRIATVLLRDRLGFDGVVVTDSLEAQAVLDRSGVAAAAERSVRAGVDLILMTGSASWNQVQPRLLELARRSPSFRGRVRRSAARVLELKRRLGLLSP